MASELTTKDIEALGADERFQALGPNDRAVVRGRVLDRLKVQGGRFQGLSESDWDVVGQNVKKFMPDPGWLKEEPDPMAPPSGYLTTPLEIGETKLLPLADGGSLDVSGMPTFPERDPRQPSLGRIPEPSVMEKINRFFVGDDASWQEWRQYDEGPAGQQIANKFGAAVKQVVSPILYASTKFMNGMLFHAGDFFMAAADKVMEKEFPNIPKGLKGEQKLFAAWEADRSGFLKQVGNLAEFVGELKAAGGLVRLMNNGKPLSPKLLDKALDGAMTWSISGLAPWMAKSVIEGKEPEEVAQDFRQLVGLRALEGATWGSVKWLSGKAWKALQKSHPDFTGAVKEVLGKELIPKEQVKRDIAAVKASVAKGKGVPSWAFEKYQGVRAPKKPPTAVPLPPLKPGEKLPFPITKIGQVPTPTVVAPAEQPLTGEAGEKVGQPGGISVYRAGAIKGQLLHFGTEVAATKASVGGREVVGGTLKINHPARMIDSGRAHDKNPVAFAEDIVAGNNQGIRPELVPVIKKIQKDKGAKAAFQAVADALKNHGYDGIVYKNVNEDPGSLSYVALEGSQFTPTGKAVKEAPRRVVPQKLELLPISDFAKKSFRSRSIGGVRLTAGRLSDTGKTTIRSITFPKKWTEDQRRGWLQEHGKALGVGVQQPTTTPTASAEITTGGPMDLSLMPPAERKLAEGILKASESAGAGELYETPPEPLPPDKLMPGIGFSGSSQVVGRRLVLSGEEEATMLDTDAGGRLKLWRQNSTTQHARSVRIIKKLHQGMSKKESEEVTAHMLGEVSSKNPKVLKAATALRKLYRFHARLAYEAGSMTKTIKNKWRPTFESLEAALKHADTYVPRLTTEKAWREMLKTEGGHWNQTIKHIQKNMKCSREKAIQIMDYHMNSRAPGDWANIERERIVEAMSGDYERNAFAIYDRYSRNYWSWYYKRRYFGYRPGVRKALPGERPMNQIKADTKARFHSEDAGNLIESILDDSLARAHSADSLHMETFLRPLRQLTIIRTIGFNFTSIVKQLNQPAVSSLSHLGVVRSLQGAFRYLDKAHRLQLEKSGVYGVRPLERMSLSEVHDTLGKVAELSMVPFSASDRTGRILGGLTGIDNVEMLLKASLGKRSWGNLTRFASNEKLKEWATYDLQEVWGLSQPEIVKARTAVLAGKNMSPTTIRNIMKRGGDMYYFQTHPEKLPRGFTMSPVTKTAILLRSFDWMQARLVAQKFIHHSAYKRRDPLPLLRLFTFALLGGEAGIAVTNWITDRDRLETDVFQRLWRDLTWVGTAGLMHDLFGNEPSKWFSSAAVDTLWKLGAAGGAAYDAVFEGKSGREVWEILKPHQASVARRLTTPRLQRQYENLYQKLMASMQRAKQPEVRLLQIRGIGKKTIWNAATQDHYGLFKSRMDEKMKLGQLPADIANYAITSHSPAAILNAMKPAATKVFIKSFGEFKPGLGTDMSIQLQDSIEHWSITSKRLTEFTQRYKAEHKEAIRKRQRQLYGHDKK